MADLLVISQTPTHPTTAGNRRRILTMLEFYEQNGIDFHFAVLRRDLGDEEAMIARWGAERCTFLDFPFFWRKQTLAERARVKIGRIVGRTIVLPYRIDDWCDEGSVPLVRALAERVKPRCVQIEYVMYSKLFECFDRTVFKILDTHDLQTDRHKLYLERGRSVEGFYTTRRQEAMGIRRADCVVAIQEGEALQFKKMTSKPVVTVSHLAEIGQPCEPTTKVPTAMFVGSGNGGNQEALDYLIGEVWPLIRAAIPDALLELYGEISGFLKGDVPGVRPMGFVSDLAAAYERAWVVISPLRIGTGIKIKSLEAMGFGKALVAAQSGYSGIEDGMGKAYLPGRSAEEFAEQCINVMRDPALRNGLERSANGYMLQWNERQGEALLEILGRGHVARRKSGQAR